METAVACPLCGTPSAPGEIAQAGWLVPGAAARLAIGHPEWKRSDGACPACVQQALLTTLLERGHEALHAGIQASWPLDAEAAFGALPTPLRLHADPRYTGRGVTVAMIDAGFYPHSDLVRPVNRIRAWVDASRGTVHVLRFRPDEIPTWPRWNDAADARWHGLMTSTVAAGNGWSSHGLYRGLASDASLVLLRVRDSDGRITNDAIARALRWVRDYGPELGVRVVSLSVAGDPVTPLAGNAIDTAVADLVAKNIVVIAAAGNDGHRHLVPPATAPEAITVGGIDDMNTFDHAALALWHSNYGETRGGAQKPELVAPSIWVVAPVLPGSRIALEASDLFDLRARGDERAEARITALKLVTPHYQHVDGTSFAAPLVASAVACMLEANSILTPALIRHALIASAQPVPGAPEERQGAGALDSGRAVALAMREHHRVISGLGAGPRVNGSGVTFLLHDHAARRVRVLGSWDGWRWPGVSAAHVEAGIWRAEHPALPPGRYTYKFLVDDMQWRDDPDNPHKIPDGHGGTNSVLIVPPDRPL